MFWYYNGHYIDHYIEYHIINIIIIKGMMIIKREGFVYFFEKEDFFFYILFLFVS